MNKYIIGFIGGVVAHKSFNLYYKGYKLETYNRIAMNYNNEIEQSNDIQKNEINESIEHDYQTALKSSIPYKIKHIVN